MQELLFEWYQQIHTDAMQSAVLHGDETGWRVDGKTNWLWCFSNPDATFYMIDRSRGSPALLKFFTTEFEGTLVTNFWGAYNAVACADRQMCLVHLLRELEQTVKYKSLAMAGVHSRRSCEDCLGGNGEVVEMGTLWWKWGHSTLARGLAIAIVVATIQVV